MLSLASRQEKIQEKRKQTSFRNFVMEICSWRNFMFYKSEVGIGKYPQTQERKMNVLSFSEYGKKDANDIEFFLEYNKNRPFLEQVSHLYHSYPYALVNHYGLQENAEWGDEVW
jgi:hypothetical protein